MFQQQAAGHALAGMFNGPDRKDYPMEKMRIAVVSTDGINVNGHFGRAMRFLIYDLGREMKLVDTRPSETLSVGDPDHAFDPDRFGRVSAHLKDCRRVYATRVGDVPAAKLKELGIEPMIYSGAIADITL